MELSEKTLQKLKTGKIQIEDLNDEYFIAENFDDDEKVYYFDGNTKTILKLLNDNICSFQQIVDRTEKIYDPYDRSCWSLLLSDENFFDKLLRNNKMTTEDLKYILNKIDTHYDVSSICSNTSLIKHILSEFILDLESVDKFNKILENERSDWCKEKNVRDIFDYIEFFNQNYNISNEKLSKLNKLNSCIYSFDLNKEQKSELIELIQDNEIAQNRLIQIVDSNLESKYDFDSLMNYLKKLERKNMLNI